MLRVNLSLLSRAEHHKLTCLNVPFSDEHDDIWKLNNHFNKRETHKENVSIRVKTS